MIYQPTIQMRGLKNISSQYKRKGKHITSLVVNLFVNNVNKFVNSTMTVTRCNKNTIISFFERHILLSAFLNTQTGRVFELHYAIVVNELNVSATVRSLILFIVILFINIISKNIQYWYSQQTIMPSRKNTSILKINDTQNR